MSCVKFSVIQVNWLLLSVKHEKGALVWRQNALYPTCQSAAINCSDALPLIVFLKPRGRAQKCIPYSVVLISQSKLKGSADTALILLYNMSVADHRTVEFWYSKVKAFGKFLWKRTVVWDFMQITVDAGSHCSIQPFCDHYIQPYYISTCTPYFRWCKQTHFLIASSIN